MLYFLADTVWSGVDARIFQVNKFTVLATDFLNYVIMIAITYTCLRYVMAVEQIPNSNKPAIRH